MRSTQCRHLAVWRGWPQAWSSSCPLAGEFQSRKPALTRLTHALEVIGCCSAGPSVPTIWSSSSYRFLSHPVCFTGSLRCLTRFLSEKKQNLSHASLVLPSMHHHQATRHRTHHLNVPIVAKECCLTAKQAGKQQYLHAKSSADYGPIDLTDNKFVVLPKLLTPFEMRTSWRRILRPSTTGIYPKLQTEILCHFEFHDYRSIFSSRYSCGFAQPIPLWGLSTICAGLG